MGKSAVPSTRVNVVRTGAVGGVILLVVGIILHHSFHRQVNFCRHYGTHTFIVTNCGRDKVLYRLGEIAMVVGPVALAVSLVLGVLLTQAARAARHQDPSRDQS